MILRGEALRTGKLLHNPAIKALVVALYGENYTKKQVYEVGEAVLNTVDWANKYNYDDAETIYYSLKRDLKTMVPGLRSKSMATTNDVIDAAMYVVFFEILKQIRPLEISPDEDDDT